MKRYGANKATEFTRKQIGVIFAKAKNNELKVEKWIMNNFYDLAEYYGYDDNGSVEEAERKILAILEAVFSNDNERAQKLIDDYTEKTWGLISRKRQNAADRNLVA